MSSGALPREGHWLFHQRTHVCSRFTRLDWRRSFTTAQPETNMHLLRIVLLSLDSKEERPTSFSAQIGAVRVDSSPLTFNGKPSEQILLTARINLARMPAVDEDGYLMAPDPETRLCEVALESVANILAVFARARRSIASASPYVALTDLSDEDRQFLECTKGFPHGYKLSVGANYSLNLGERDLLTALADRVEGLALLAEALSVEHAVARYRELLRFFENAFARPVTHLDKKLARFLGQAKLGYTRDEVREWFWHRHGAIHGDHQETHKLVFERDVRQFIPRLDQAAYEVLFNKKKWHDPSDERIEILRPRAATISSVRPDISMVAGSGVAFRFQISDPRGAFPLHLGGILTSPPPEWWWEPRESKNHP